LERHDIGGAFSANLVLIREQREKLGSSSPLAEFLEAAVGVVGTLIEMSLDGE
jgi:hypothetical protein